MPVIIHNTGGAGGLFKKITDALYRLKKVTSAISVDSAEYPALAALTILPGASGWTVNGKPAKYLENYIRSFTVTGTYSAYIVAPYYLTTDKENGILSIALKTNTTSYENVFIQTVVDNTGLGITKLAETHVTQSAGKAGDYSAAFFSNVTHPVNLTLNASSRNATYDYIVCTLTVDPV